jgi:hypothetical protein
MIRITTGREAAVSGNVKAVASHGSASILT